MLRGKRSALVMVNGNTVAFAGVASTNEYHRNAGLLCQLLDLGGFACRYHEQPGHSLRKQTLDALLFHIRFVVAARMKDCEAQAHGGVINAAEHRRTEIMLKVLLVIGDAAEATDTLYPYFRVQEEGYQCPSVSI